MLIHYERCLLCAYRYMVITFAHHAFYSALIGYIASREHKGFQGAKPCINLLIPPPEGSFTSGYLSLAFEKQYF